MPGPPTSSVLVDGVDIVPGMGSNVGNVMSTYSCGVHEAVCRGVVHSEELPRNCAHYLVPIICMNINIIRGLSARGCRRASPS